MQTAPCTSVRDRVNDFLANPCYVLLVMLFTAVSFVLGADLIAYTVFAVLAIYICLFGADLLPLIPLVVCCYCAPSVANNPGRSESAIFAPEHGGIYLLCLGGLITVSLIYRVIRDRKQFFSEKRALLSGMLVLAAAYLLSGIGSENYTALAGKNILFALLQGVSVVVPYWLLTGGVNWKNTRRDYFAWVGFGLGCMLLSQILWIYCTGGVIVDGIIVREKIYTGWGMYNNVGCLLAMMIPFAFYLASKYHKGWIGTVVGSAFLLGVFLTCSRTSIAVAVLCYAVCVCMMLFYARNRRDNALALVIVVGMLSLTFLLFHRQLFRLFSDILERGTDLNSRDTMYVRGWEKFLENPIFGISFYPPRGLAWSWSKTELAAFIPDRWHSTVVQLLASGGIVSLGAYGFHRYQTLRLVLKSKTQEQLLIACSVVVLLLCSLFDCHFFNIGPTLIYSMALAFGEKRG